MDQPDHDHLGHRWRALTALVKTPVAVLLGPVPARAWPRRAFSRGHRLSDALVPQPRPGARAGRRSWSPRRSRRSSAPRFRICSCRSAPTETIDGVTVTPPAGHGAGRLAVGVHRLGHPRGGARRGRLLLPDRPPAATRSGSARGARGAGARAEREKGAGGGKHRMTVSEALRHPKVLMLALAYFLSS